MTDPEKGGGVETKAAEPVEAEVVQEQPAPSQAITVSDPSMTALVSRLTQDDLIAIDYAIMRKDYSKLSLDQKHWIVHKRCLALGVNIIHSPFVWGDMKGKVALIPTKNLFEQLRANRGINIEILDSKLVLEKGIYFVKVRATEISSGRFDEDIGVTGVGILEGEALGNAMMTAITKSKNRVTGSICGVGGVDETEVESVNRLAEVQREQPRVIDPSRPTLEIVEKPKVQEQPKVEAKVEAKVEPKPAAAQTQAPAQPQPAPRPAPPRPPVPRPAGFTAPRPPTKAPAVPFPRKS